MTAIKRTTIITLLILTVALFLSTASWAQQNSDPEKSTGPWNLTVFHTNDSHSKVFPRPATWRDDKKMVGGAVPLVHHLNLQRKTAASSILLDAGDFMTGNPICEFEENGVKGAAVAKVMNLIGYDVGVIGNHEFDTGAPNVKSLAKLFTFPMMAADIVDRNQKPVFRREPVILERGGLRVGVMGVSATGMTEVVMPTRLGGLQMTPQAALVKSQLAELIPVTDVQILITHNGVGNDIELAHQLAGSGLDVIVGGHSHSRLKNPKLEGGILIVQAGSKMTNLGRLDLWVEDGRVVRYNGQLIDLWAEGATAGAKLTNLIDGYQQEIDEKFGAVIGNLESNWKKSRGENHLGNWICDAMHQRAESDVAFFNSGGLRKGLAAGPITTLDIMELLPFANLLVTAEISGAQLGRIIQQNADASINNKHGILQVAGLKYCFRANSDSSAAIVEELLVKGKPLNPQKTYKVALPDYVAMMADVYLKITMPPVTDIDGGITVNNAVVDAIKNSGPLVNPVGGRIINLDKQK